MTRPPCWPDGHPCPNPCAQAHYARTVHGHHHLTAEWQGWRLAGAVLVSPEGDRIRPERLRGILFTEQLRARRQKRFARKAIGQAVVSLPARERFVGSA